MTKSELIEIIARKQTQLPYKDVELSVKALIEQMAQSLSTGERIEIRGFGSFSLHFRPPRVGRNPKTGESVELAGKYGPHYIPGNELRVRVNEMISSQGISRISKNGIGNLPCRFFCLSRYNCLLISFTMNQFLLTRCSDETCTTMVASNGCGITWCEL